MSTKHQESIRFDMARRLVREYHSYEVALEIVKAKISTHQAQISYWQEIASTLRSMQERSRKERAPTEVPHD